MKRTLFLFLILCLLIALPASAADYYVNRDTPGALDSNPGTAMSPWLTIGQCVLTMVAGDTCNVTGGTYDVRVTATADGTALLPIRYIGSGGAKVRSFTLNAAPYTYIEGFEITMLGMGADAGFGVSVSGATGNRILDNTIHSTNAVGCIFHGTTDGLIIRGNTIYSCGLTTPTFLSGPAITTTSAGGSNTNVLIEDNWMYLVSDYLNPSGSNYVYRNNTIGPDDPNRLDAVHIDGMQNNAVTTDSLMEGNYSLDNKNGHNHFFLNQQSASSGWIVRYNYTLRSKAMFDIRGADGTWIYNNTVYDAYEYTDNNNPQVLMDAAATGTVARNNIWYRATSLTQPPYSGSVDKDYDLCFQQRDCVETNDVLSNPNFIDATNGNFNLSPGSPAINAGTHLTTVAVADTGTGTSLIVGNAHAFQPGWAGADPDCIAVGTSSNTACIVSINYGTNTITLDGSLTRLDADPVYLFKKSDGVTVLRGSRPDIGAFESDAPDTTAPVPGSSGTITAGSVLSTTLSLSWAEATDAVTAQASLVYQVYRSASNNISSVANAEANGTVIQSYIADISGFSVSGLTPATTYYFNVIVKDEAGNKAAYTTVSQATAAGSMGAGGNGRRGLRR